MKKKRKIIPVDLYTERISIEDLEKISGGVDVEEGDIPQGDTCPECSENTLYAFGVPGILGHPSTVCEMCIKCGYTNQYSM